MPNLTIIDPCDALDIREAVPQIADHPGPVYMRLLRGQVPLVLDEYDYRFQLGKAALLRDGADVLILSSGLMTMRALEAAKALAGDRIDVGVLHVPTIKPLDEAAILSACGRPEPEFGRDAPGEAVAGLLMRAGVHPAFRQVALPDAFLDAGALPTLHERYGLSTDALCRQVRSWL